MINGEEETKKMPPHVQKYRIGEAIKDSPTHDYDGLAQKNFDHFQKPIDLNQIRARGLPDKTPERQSKTSFRWKDVGMHSLRIAIIVAGGLAVFFWICSQRNPSDGSKIGWVGEANYSLPAYFELKSPMIVGQNIHIVGNIKEDATKICVYLLKNDTDPSTLLRVCSFFTKDSGLTDGYSEYTAVMQNGTETSKTTNPYERLGEYDLRMRILSGYVQVFAQGGEIGIFERPDLSEVTHVVASGDFDTITLISISGGNYSNPFTGSYTLPFNYRLDIAAQPLPKVDSTLVHMENLLETPTTTVSPNKTEMDDPFKNYELEHRRVKRKGSFSSRGSSGARSSSSGSRASSTSRSTSGVHSTVQVASRSYGGATGGRSTFNFASSPILIVPPSYSYRTTTGSIIYMHSYSGSHATLSNGFLYPTSKMVNISLIADENTYPMQVSINFQAKTIERNAKVDGVWGEVEKKGSMPMDNWRIFSCTIVNSNSTFEIYFNGVHFTPFKQRTTKSVLRVHLEGDLELFSIGSTLKTQ
ncbi:unnamed protein product, partial [Mesorhabditis belari]|uniref:Galectin n=1 Tax=Mesorhabditis belari TaxID=2138241 RepID=A0AAF3J6W1_9BILA